MRSWRSGRRSSRATEPHVSGTDFLLSPNWFIRAVHLLLLVVFTIAIIGIGYFTVIELIQQDGKSIPWFIFVFLLFLIIGLVSTWLILFVRPSSVRIRSADGCWTLSTLTKASKPFFVQDIEGFSTSEVLAGKGWESWPTRLLVILYLRDGRIEEVSGFSVQNIGFLVKKLRENDVRHLGDESTWYPFKKRRYKFTK